MIGLDATFAKKLGGLPTVTARAPGRVNLIGEHTDYTGGYVLPVAIPQTTRVALAPREDQRVRMFSKAFAPLEPETFELGREAKRGSWVDYVMGTTVALAAAGYVIRGFDAVIASNVPIGAGLSSSAALEVALLRALREAFQLNLDDVALAKIGRAAETDFVGAPVGIMDQMAASLADVATALFIDTRTLDWTRHPLPRGGEIVVVDSGVAHDHATGDYATRRAECERAMAILGVESFRDVTDPARIDELPEPLRRRARHVFTENARVLEAVACLRTDDLDRLGALLDSSHASLRDDFEVSVPEVDRLVEIAQSDPDVFGARMTGGGFGGAIVAFARRGTGRAAAERIVAAYGPAGRALVPEKSEEVA
jgi:galactokinase